MDGLLAEKIDNLTAGKPRRDLGVEPDRLGLEGKPRAHRRRLPIEQVQEPDGLEEVERLESTKRPCSERTRTWLSDIFNHG